ncbi:MAG: hypothetical protein J6J18_01655 [Oscillospiraceae bacterium]|nr:hypothetical protein [Oscillospiraceae bacterium]
MKRNDIKNAYDQMTPSPYAKDRMLEKILDRSVEVKMGHSQIYEKIPETRWWTIIPAVLAVLVLVVGGIWMFGGIHRVEEPVYNDYIAPTQPTDPTEETQSAAYSETFESDDGTIEFAMNIEESLTAEKLPTFEVVPHQITAEEAKRVAQAIFGDAEFYEKVPDLEEFYTKAEIQQKLDRWSQYTTREALDELYGDYMTDYREEDFLRIINSFIEEYTEKYDTAPEENPYTPCEWTFKNGSVYSTPADELAGEDTSEWNDNIEAQLYVGDIPYRFCASNRDKEDFKVNILSACISTGITPSGIDEEIFKARLLRTGEPTQEQIDAVKAKAEEMLENMDMGKWFIDECYADSYQISDDVLEYTVYVNAVPVLDGIPAVRMPQFTALRGEDPDMKNYYYADVEFEFSANGDLISFSMYSPIEIVDTMDSGEVMTVGQLVDEAKEYLAATNASNYSWIPAVYSGDDELCCRIDVDGLDYSLTRINADGENFRFYYVPGLTITGTVEY